MNNTAREKQNNSLPLEKAGIPVFYALSDGYALVMGVSIASLLHNTNALINFHIIEDG